MQGQWTSTREDVPSATSVSSKCFFSASLRLSGLPASFSVPLCLCGEMFLMPTLRLKIDVSGTGGDEAWSEINQFDQIQSASFGLQFGSGGLVKATAASPALSGAKGAVSPSEARRNSAISSPYPKGAWIGAEIKLQTPLLAQYAMSHYLEQERVLDADIID